MGPLSGFRVIELAGIGPCPMAGMMLADMGAEVIRVERSTQEIAGRYSDVSLRGKKSIALNLKSTLGVETLLRLVENAHALIEGYRPGVMERLGAGPEVCQARNRRLIYGRMTGWGQDGPLACTAGHDVNYIALTGALHAIGRRGERPVPPLNLLGDMGGGGMLLAFGVVCGLLEARRSGQGQVIDAAMIDGTAQLMWMIHSMHATGSWNAEERGVNLLDGAAPFYDTYETSDHKYVAIGAIEPQFYGRFIELIGADRAFFDGQVDSSRWPDLKAKLAVIFKAKTRDEWCRIMEGSDACFAPVLTLSEAPDHPHNRARHSYFRLNGQVQPAPAPRFSRSRPEVSHGARPPGADGESILLRARFSAEEIAQLTEKGAFIPAAEGSP